MNRTFTRGRKWSVRAIALVLLSLLTSPADSAHAQGSICAEGGGSVSRGDWAGPVFKWMVDQARPLAQREAADIRVVVIGSREVGMSLDPALEDPDEGPDPLGAAFKLAGAAEITPFWVNSTNASDEGIATAIRAAHIVWMRGGSQSRYVEFWKGTPIEHAIRSVFDRGGVIGGTSAGCAVLGEFIYDAAGGSCAPMEALRDPFAKSISFTSDFLRLTPGVIFDSHFTERARFTRLAVYLGRIHAAHDRRLLGIGVDTRTALCIGPDGTATVLGTGAVCLMHLTDDTRLHIANGVAPSITDIATTQLVAGQSINIRELAEAAAAVKPQALPQPEFVRQIDPLDRPHARGDAPLHSTRGAVTIRPGSPADAVFDGVFAVDEAEKRFPEAFIIARALGTAAARQNAAGGLCWTLAEEKVRWGVLLDTASAVMLDPDGAVRAYFPFGRLGAPMSSAIICATADFKPGPKPPAARQAAAFSGARSHILADRWGFDPRTGRGIAPGETIAPSEAPEPAAP